MVTDFVACGDFGFKGFFCFELVCVAGDWPGCGFACFGCVTLYSIC